MTTFQFPFFESGQVLTSEDLNGLVRYLDGENRTTRTDLIGMGIFRGLEVNWDQNNKSINISEGVGLSSKGYLFSLPTLNLGYYQEVKVPKSCFIGGEDKLSEFTLYQLNETDNRNGSKAITKNFLEGKIVVTHYRIDEENPGTCFSETDNLGKDINIHINLYLAELSEVKESLFQSDKTEPRPGNVPPTPEDHSPYIERFGYQGKVLPTIGLAKPGNPPTISLEKINSYKAFIANYNSIIHRAILSIENRIVKALIDLDQKYGQLFNQKGAFDHLYSTLKTLKDNTNPLYLQYLHDYIKDLILAYDEFMQLEKTRQLGVQHSADGFPYFLSLGKVVDKDGNYRTPFIPSPFFSNLAEKGFDKAKLLYDRLVKLAAKGSFNPKLAKNEIKITPSRGKNLFLSQRAIPFYYNNIDELRSCWSHELRNKSNSIPSYYMPTGTTTPLDRHLLYDLDAWEFFRIEGLLGKDLVHVIANLQDQRLKFNLPFDIRCLRLGKELLQEVNTGEEAKFMEFEIDDSIKPVFKKLSASYDHIKESENFKNFALKNPGMEHQAGVSKGGTFLIIYKEKKTNLFQSIESQFGDKPKSLQRELNRYYPESLVDKVVVADFCLPYTFRTRQPSVIYHIKQAEPSVVLIPETFCSNDSNQYPIFTSPEEGTLKPGPGIKGPDTENPVFSPSSIPPDLYKNGPAEIGIAYTYQGKVAVQKIKVFKAPDVSYKEAKRVPIYDKRCELIGYTITLNNTTVTSEKQLYRWLFKEQEMGSNAPFTHDFLFEEGMTREVTLEVKTGKKCSGSLEITLDLCPTETVSIELANPQTDFLENGSGEVQVIVSPLGGQFGILYYDVNSKVGKPEELSIAPKKIPDDCQDVAYYLSYKEIKTGTYKILYGIKGCKASATLTITVPQDPKAELVEASNPKTQSKKDKEDIPDTPMDIKDLQIVEGIGPAIEKVLKKAGIDTLEALANTEMEKIKEILDSEGGPISRMNPATWSKQAKLAAEGKLDELQNLKDNLRGGVDTKDPG